MEFVNGKDYPIYYGKIWKNKIHVPNHQPVNIVKKDMASWGKQKQHMEIDSWEYHLYMVDVPLPCLMTPEGKILAFAHSPR